MVNAGSTMRPDDGTLRASAILARAQLRDVHPNIWASLRSDSGLPAWALSRYAATAASLTAPASGTAWSRCPLSEPGRAVNSGSRRSPTTSRRGPTRASSRTSSMSSWPPSSRSPRCYSPPRTKTKALVVQFGCTAPGQIVVRLADALASQRPG
jgi:hypothetical protein